MSSLSLEQVIYNALTELASAELDVEIAIERPTVSDFGDWSSNISLVVAKKLDKPPMDVADSLAEILNRDKSAHIERVEVAPPGFLNFFLSNTWLYEALDDILELGETNFARHDFGAGTKILVEFVSANPTGPLHVGHAKGAVFGDSLARVFERCGFDVSKENYVNDLGTQIDLYIESLKASLDGIEPPEDGYMGAYISEWVSEIKTAESQEIDVAELRDWGIDKALSDQKNVLEELGIEFDAWFNESSLKESDKLDKVLKKLKKESMVYEKDGASWLKTSSYGDDKDRVLVKSDGAATYLLPDIAYHQDKLKRADKLINVWGADHHGYIARLKAALSAIGEDPDRLEIKIAQLVRLESEGEEIKISKRTGDIILLSDLLEMLGADVVRFTFLLHSTDSAQTVDLEKAATQSMENPVYYVQYAHTRICSIIQNPISQNLLSTDEAVDLSLLTHPRELELIRILTEMPDLVKKIAQELSPHRLTHYLGELAKVFHSFYHDCRVTGDGIDSQLSKARLKLLKAVQIGLVVGLNLCGVSAPEKM